MQAASSALKMEAVPSSDMSVNYRTAWRNNPEDSTLHNHGCENLEQNMKNY
jgi:hypothetical protein